MLSSFEVREWKIKRRDTTFGDGGGGRRRFSGGLARERYGDASFSGTSYLSFVL